MLKPTQAQEELSQQVYRDFCEDGGLNDHPFQDAWDAYQVKEGPIEIGSLVDRLIHQAVLYGMQAAQSHRSPDSEPLSNQEYYARYTTPGSSDPAMPVPGCEELGITKLEYMATQIFAQMVIPKQGFQTQAVAEEAVNAAIALLKELNRPHE